MTTTTTTINETPLPTLNEKSTMLPAPTTYTLLNGTYSWEKGPMSLVATPRHLTGATDQYTLAASEMALVHNCVIRALNSIYIQAPHIPASEHANFVCYALSAYQGLTMHHDGEEEMFFPKLEKITGEVGIMEANVQGHRDFDTHFNAWGKWLESCVAKKEDFDATKCRAMMDAFIPPLSAHLNAEIPTLLGLARFGDKLDLAEMFKEEGEQVMGSMSKTAQLPMFLLNHDVEFEGGIHNFPPVPPPVRWVLREVFGRWNAAWWKFAACGFDGRARELAFLGEEK